jgi:VWFA-related protein
VGLPTIGPRGGNPSGVLDPLEMEILARAAEVYDGARQRNVSTLGVLQRCLDSLSGSSGRKAVVLVSEGFQFDSSLTGFREVVQASFRANAAVYFLDARGLEAGTTYQGVEFGAALDPQDLSAAAFESMDAADGAEHVALDSGGLVVRNTNDLTAGFREIAEEASVYYLLGYTPSNDRADGKFRRIEVKLARKGLKARARKGYFAPLPRP